jgi:2-phosphosulfolactate phosphatase
MSKIKIVVEKIHRKECASADGLVIVIDVIRAFTTAAFAFAAGAEKIILVGTVEEAFNIHARHPEYLLMGEVDGYPIGGFHFGNSPVEIAQQDLTGKTLIQRTSSGTQGVVNSINAERILTSSFVVAKATLQRIMQAKPAKVTFVITGLRHGGHEDWALADYLEACLDQANVQPQPYLQRVLESPSARRAFEEVSNPVCSKADLDTVIQLDRFPFAMEVFKENGLHVMKKVHTT